MYIRQLLSRIELLNYAEINASLVELENCGLTNINLRDYQIKAANWIISRFKGGHGCILADEMGLGKTCTSIATLLYMKKYCSFQSCLIICPLSIADNWLSEINRFAPNLSAIKLVGNANDRNEILNTISDCNPDIILTTYEMLIAESQRLLGLRLSMCIIDEAHRLKNTATHAHRIAATIKCPNKLLLTGTPVQNNMMELYSMLKLVAPKLFIDSYADQFVMQFNNFDINTENADLLSRTIVNFIMRRTKSQVLPDLPIKTETTIYHGLNALQKRIYRSILTKNSDSVIGNGSVSITNLLNILMQLRKCILHPYFFKGIEPEPFVNGEHLVSNSGKMVVLDALLKRLWISNHKALIFSKFTTMLDIVQDYMNMRKFTYERLDGNIRGEERYAAINSFSQNSETKFFLLSTLAGGVGLNLASADTVVFLDIDFNPQNDLQALSRCHRLGQSRNVKVFRLLCKGTVEEMILKRQLMKLNLASTVLQNDNLSGLVNPVPQSRDELRKLIGFCAERVFVDNDEDDKVDVDKVIACIDVGQDGKWPGNSLAEPKENDYDDNVNCVDMYEFEGKKYGSLNKNRLKQIIEQRKENTIPVKRRKTVKVASSTYDDLDKMDDERDQKSESNSQSSDNDDVLSDICYVRGDVAEPLSTIAERCSISVLSVDNSGTWPASSCLFQSFANHCPLVQSVYSMKGTKKELKMGECVLVMNGKGQNRVALFVCIFKGGGNILRTSHFNKCLKSLVRQLSITHDYDIHFSRIGFSTKGLNWYALERLIKKNLCNQPNLRVFIHYLPRDKPTVINEDTKPIQLSFPAIFQGLHITISDADQNDDTCRIERLAIAYGAESVKSVNTPNTLLTTNISTSTTSNENNNIFKIVTKQWILEQIKTFNGTLENK
ncbi:hypothetical protein GJ496_008153 [Pomphorhynchus laevis]|nr:hypothetical protein GJ496_008153 [Pomphorhynchus laevis]